MCQGRVGSLQSSPRYPLGSFCASRLYAMACTSTLSSSSGTKSWALHDRFQCAVNNHDYRFTPSLFSPLSGGSVLGSTVYYDLHTASLSILGYSDDVSIPWGLCASHQYILRGWFPYGFAFRSIPTLLNSILNLSSLRLEFRGIMPEVFDKPSYLSR